MSTTFQLASLFGIVIGYFIRFAHELWLERTWGTPVRKQNLAADSEEEEDTPTHDAGPHIDAEPQTLRQQWGLPGQSDADREREARPPTYCTPRAPEGYTAKQILGYSDFGTPHPHQYPGGFKQWRKDHGDYYGQDSE